MINYFGNIKDWTQNTKISLLESMMFVVLSIGLVIIFFFEGGLLYRFIQGVINGHIVPIKQISDGIDYYLSSQAFYYFKIGDISSFYFHGFNPFPPLFHSGPHGIAYAAFFGSLAHVFGNYVSLIPVVNVLLVLISVLLLCFFYGLVRDRFLAIGLFLGYPVVMIYQATYMQEIIQLFFSVVFFGVLVRAKKNKVLVLGCLFCIFSLFRPIYVLTLPCLVLMSQKGSTKFKIISFLIAMLVSVVVCWVYIKLFFAPYHFGFLYILTQTISQGHYLDAIGRLVSHFISNTVQFIFQYPFIPGYEPFVYHITQFNIALVIFSALFYGFRDNAINLRYVGLTSLFAFLLVMSFYDVFGWRDVRSLSFFYLISVFTLIWEKKYWVPFLSFLLSLLLVFMSYSAATAILTTRLNSIISNNVKTVNQKVAKYNCVVISYSNLNYQLPVKNKMGRITYYFDALGVSGLDNHGVLGHHPSLPCRYFIK